MTGLVLAMSNPWWVRDPFNHPNRLLHRHGVLPTMGTGTCQPYQTNRSAIWGTVMNHHSLRLLNQTSGITQLFQANPGMPKMWLSLWECWMNQCAHQGHDLSHMCYSAPKGCSSCLSSTRSDRCRVASYLAHSQATKAH